MKTLKVWGGLTSAAGKPQSRTLVAAKTKKRAVELLKQVEPTISMYYFSGYWAETRNIDEELATAAEEGVWVYVGEDWKSHFKRLV